MEGKVILIISFGAFLGAIARYELQEQLGKNQTINFPLGTFAVNVLGVFFLGIIYGGGAIVQGMNSFFFLVTGFIGAFATFSSFIYEIYKMIENKRYHVLLIYLLTLIIFSSGLYVVGYETGKVIWS